MKTLSLLRFITACIIVSTLFGCKEKSQLPAFQLHDLSITTTQQNIQTIDLETIASTTETIQLDTNEQTPILGIINHLYECKDFIYIIADGCLYRYSKTGNFDIKIGAKGRGPGEYLYISSISTNITDKSINLFDVTTQSLLKYDNEGNYLSKNEIKPNETYTYLRSFFPYNNSLIFGTLSNSVIPNIYIADPSTNEFRQISKQEREMEEGEVIMGSSILFGDPSKPIIYNYFNDTIYTINNNTLQPQLLAKGKELRMEFEMLTLDKLAEISSTYLQMSNIVQLGDNLLFFYTLSRLEGQKRVPILSLYNTTTNTYSQNITISDKSGQITITSRDKVVQGPTSNQITIVKENNQLIHCTATTPK